MTAVAKPDPYNFPPPFEREVVLLCCTGHHARMATLEAEAMGDPVAKLVVAAVTEFAKDHGAGPTKVHHLIEHLCQRMNAGKVTLEQVKAVSEYLQEAEDAFPPPDPEQVIKVVSPELQRRATAAALEVGFETFSKRGDVTGVVIDLMTRAQRIGQPAAEGIGDPLELSGFDEFTNGGGVQYLSTGTIELDRLLGGGAVRGELAVVSMATGGGKSMTLAQFAAQSIWEGHNTLVATTELTVKEWKARLYANLTSVPIEHIRAGRGHGFDAACKTFKERCLRFGLREVRDFTAGASTVADLRAWASGWATRTGRKVDTLIVDSADDLTVLSKGKNEVPAHERVKAVYLALRALVKDELDVWCWTASQPKGASSTGRARKRIGTDDLADGMAKSRVCDKLVTAHVDEDQATVDFWLPKNRTGKARVSTGPIPLDLACGMIGPVVRFPPGGASKVP